jgi:hypothetical protein
LNLSCREETREHKDDESSEKTNPLKSLEEEYLETEKKVGFANFNCIFSFTVDFLHVFSHLFYAMLLDIIAAASEMIGSFVILMLPYLCLVLQL